jgi:hypothetical protein
VGILAMEENCQEMMRADENEKQFSAIERGSEEKKHQILFKNLALRGKTDHKLLQNLHKSEILEIDKGGCLSLKKVQVESDYPIVNSLLDR